MVMQKDFVVALTGTPGTGKTKVAQALAKRTGWACLDLNRETVKRGLYSGYDRARRSYMADMRRVTIFTREFLRKNQGAIIEGHLAHELPPELLNAVVVLRVKPAVLEKRLEKRRWPKLKIRENVEAETIGLIAWEARQRHRHVLEVDASRAKPSSVAAEIEKALKTKNIKYGSIDWLK